MKHQKALGNGMLLITAIIWGTAFVAQRVGMDHIGPITFTAARMALAAVAVGAVALINKHRSVPERNREKTAARRRATVKGGVLCGVFLASATIFQQMGLVTTTAGKAGFITAMYILLVPLLGSVFFQKRNPWPVWAAVLLGVAGMYLLCVTEGLRLTRGDSLVSVSALVFSFHILCCDHFAPRGDPIGISAIQFLTATLVSTVIALIMEEPSGGQLLSAAVPILYCGLISGGVGYTLQIVAQQFTDPTVASLLMSMESVFAVLAGAVLLKETMSLRELAGSLLMFAAIVLVQLPWGLRRGETGSGEGE